MQATKKIWMGHILKDSKGIGQINILIKWPPIETKGSLRIKWDDDIKTVETDECDIPDMVNNWKIIVNGYV